MLSYTIKCLKSPGSVAPLLYVTEHFDLQEGSIVGCLKEKCTVSAANLESHEPVHTQYGSCCGEFLTPDKDIV